MNLLRSAMLIMAALLAGAASAPGQPADASLGAEACTLHVFSSPLPTGPAKDTSFVRVAGASSDPFYWGNLGHPTQRIADVTDDEIRQALGLGSDYEVVRHADRVITKKLAKSSAPLVAGSRRCYAELLAYGGNYLSAERNHVNGREAFGVSFHYREYAGSETPRLEVDGMGGSEARRFKNRLETDREAALADLHTASKDLLSDFGRKVARKRDEAAGR
jgi:hypothetical protein